MAELGETCTHIAAVLFYLEAVHRFEEAKTCTQGLCTWSVPERYKAIYFVIDPRIFRQLCTEGFPVTISSAFDSSPKAEYEKLNYHELLHVCKNVSISITQEMSTSIETETS